MSGEGWVVSRRWKMEKKKMKRKEGERKEGGREMRWGRGGENGEEEEEMGNKEIIRNLRSEKNGDKNNSKTIGVIWKHKKKIKKK